MNWKSVVSAAALVLVASTISWAQDGAALYKAKCAACHGTNGEGKPAVKAPALKATKLDASQLAQYLTKGDPQKKAPHNKAISGLSEEQAKAIAGFVATLK